MEPHMCLKGDDILEASLLEVADNEPGASPSLAKETTLLGKDPTLWEAQETCTHPLDCLEETPKPDVTAGVAGLLDIQWQLPLLPLGFGLRILISGLPPLEDVDPLVYLPGEAQLDITSLASMEMVTVRNALMGEFKCHYRMWLFSMTSLWLNWSLARSQPGADQKLMDYWTKLVPTQKKSTAELSIEWVTFSENWLWLP